MDVEENPGRLAKRDEQRRQRRSIFMTALIGSTVTAILAAAAAFRIDNTSAKTVRIVTTTTLPPAPSTTSTEPDTTLTTLFQPDGSGGTSKTTAAATTTTPAIPVLPSIPDFTPSTTVPTTTPVTGPPPPGAKANVVWQLTPGAVTVQSGAQTTVTITATNHGNAAGSVVVPPCPAPPRRYSRYSVVHSDPGSAGSSSGPAGAFDNTCHPGPQVLLINPGQTYSWTDTIAATTDTTRYGAALSPGNYLVLVYNFQPLTMFLRMTVTS